VSEEQKKSDDLVAKFVEDVYNEGGRRQMTYNQLCQAAERLHLTALFYRFGGKTEEVADYVEAYGQQVADMLEDGTIQFDGNPGTAVLH